jgi:UDP-N-acetylmuramoyl-tripeptide--D-alanyl-D-alanine ligase
MTFSDIKRLLPNAQMINFEHSQANQQIRKFGSDSRQIEEDELFVAIKGERFDGNRYLKDVLESGAIAAIASDKKQIPEKLPTVLVEDSVLGIAQLSAAWRRELGTKLAVVTGSNGKTTVKEMIFSIFSKAVGEDQAIATRGNLNNEIGLPMTLLRLNRAHQLGVIELGMNHPGETAILAKVAMPNVALINNAQREHQEFMKDVEAVAHEHADVIDALGANGIAVFPAESEYASFWREKAGSRQVIDFEFSPNAKYTSDAVVKGSWLNVGILEIQVNSHTVEKFNVRLSTLGEHNARNALAATAVAYACGVKTSLIAQGLESFMPVVGRMQVMQMPDLLGHGLIIDDSYNANPDSVRAAIDVLAALEGDRWLALGDMGEVGERGQEYHREVGEYASERGIDYLFATGELTQESVLGFNQDKTSKQHAQHFEDVKTLSDEMIARMKVRKAATDKSSDKKISILVKGSRFTKMERVVNYLLQGESTCC